MIRVKRYSPEELGVNEDLITKLATETEKAIAHYNEEIEKFKKDKTYKIKSFSFDAYGKTKPDLINVYNAKCAYCEITVDTAQPGDVEHFRPKAAIDTRFDGIENLSQEVIQPPDDLQEIKPGYYWLGADWNNLLLSCNACNRRKETLNAAKNSGTFLSEETLKKETLGKGSRFPYVDAQKRVSKPGTPISQEKDFRLLIDPGEDDPRDHIRFVKHLGRKKTIADTAVIETEEKFGMIEGISDKGVASIQIFGLARYKLVLKREREAHELMRDLADLKGNVINYIEALDVLKTDPDNNFAIKVRDSTLEGIEEKMDDLSNHFRNSSLNESPSQFLGMKRTMVRNWITAENKVISYLNKLGMNVEEVLILDIIRELNFIRKLTLDVQKAIANNDGDTETDKIEIIKKVWNTIIQEVADGAEYAMTKKALIEGWVEFMNSNEEDKMVLDTLKKKGFDLTEIHS